MMKLAGAALQQVRFVECKLLGVDLSVCSEMLFSVGFERCVMDHAVLSGRRMRGTRFIQCTMRGVDLERADLEAAVLDRCDLRDAVFERTTLRDADLTTVIDHRIDPTRNDLKGARFSVEGALGLLAGSGIVVEH